jgi:hypothetical protein
MASGQFYITSGHCFIGALLKLDQRIQSVTGPARSVELRASGPRDQCIRSARLLLNLVSNGSI